MKVNRVEYVKKLTARETLQKGRLRSCGMKLMLAGLAALTTAMSFAALTTEQRKLLSLSLIHRGDGLGRPDNTMEALLYTWGKGYTPESDIRFTKDGKIIAFHDKELKGAKISEWTWEALREEDVGSYRGAQYSTCRAPMWETIFTAMSENPGRRIHIDYKDVPPEKVAELVKAHHLERQCYFICKDHGLLRRYKKALPNGLALQWMNLGNWGRIDFEKPGETAKCEKYMMDIFERSAADGFKDLDMVQLHCQVRKLNGRYAFCPSEATLKTCVDRLNAAGIPPTVFVWKEEANDPEVYRRLFKLGFAAFGTDYPEALYKAIASLEME